MSVGKFRKKIKQNKQLSNSLYVSVKGKIKNFPNASSPVGMILSLERGGDISSVTLYGKINDTYFEDVENEEADVTLILENPEDLTQNRLVQSIESKCREIIKETENEQ